MFLAEILKGINIGAENLVTITDFSYVNALLILAASLILAKIADFVFEKVFLKITAHTKTDLDDKIVAGLKAPIYYIVIIIGVYAARIYSKSS